MLMTPLLLDVNAPEFLLLLVLAIILFGPERLPDLARKAARIVQYVRTLAGNAQDQLSKELGPGFENLDFRDLNPKAFVQKHLLDEVQPIVADVKAELTDVSTTVTGAAGDISAAIEGARDGDPVTAAVSSEPRTPFDPDAT
ncbi:sec-independent translocase [uncultured Friedmanniella sp.]|uniref:sec-independent translocase n=1 Tax=uncultured Friedmanniella sp. TaxID=335381 RepID=UPI0035CC0F43